MGCPECTGALQVEAGKQGNSCCTGGHTPPTVVHLENIRMRRAEGGEKMWRRRFMQIDGGAGVDVAADVGVQEEGVAPAANIQHPT